MDDNANDRRDYVKFNGINFPQWKFGVMLKLRMKKLDPIVLGIETRPVEVIAYRWYKCLVESLIKISVLKHESHLYE